MYLDYFSPNIHLYKHLKGLIKPCHQKTKFVQVLATHTHRRSQGQSNKHEGVFIVQCSIKHITESLLSLSSKELEKTSCDTYRHRLSLAVESRMKRQIIKNRTEIIVNIHSETEKYDGYQRNVPFENNSCRPSVVVVVVSNILTWLTTFVIKIAHRQTRNICPLKPYTITHASIDTKIQQFFSFFRLFFLLSY